MRFAVCLPLLSSPKEHVPAWLYFHPYKHMCKLYKASPHLTSQILWRLFSGTSGLLPVPELPAPLTLSKFQWVQLQASSGAVVAPTHCSHMWYIMQVHLNMFPSMPG